MRHPAILDSSNLVNVDFRGFVIFGVCPNMTYMGHRIYGMNIDPI